MMSALLVTGCAVSRPSGSLRIGLPALDARLAQPCARPVAIAGEAVTSAQVERGWARDRAELIRCGDQKAAIVEGYGDLRGQLAEPRR